MDVDRSISYVLEKVGCSSEQMACIKYIYQRNDVFLWLLTRLGKSLCYEVLPFVFDNKVLSNDSVVIVVSPFIFLIMDQVPRLRENGSYVVRAEKNIQGVSGNSVLCSRSY